MVAKLLGDPTYFPIEFRRWLQDFMGNADFKISQSQIIGGGAGGGATGPTLLPAGIILPYAGTNIGKDVLVCNGSAISRTDYNELYDAIGQTWGSGDGSTTFNVPDLRDRALYGAGTVVNIGSTDGKGSSSRGGPNHSHAFSGNTGNAGGHGHSVSGSIGAAPNHGHDLGGGQSMVYVQLFTAGTQGGVYNLYYPQSSQTGQAGAHGHSFSGSASNVGDHQHGFSGRTAGPTVDQPSYAGVRYCITTGRADASPSS